MATEKRLIDANELEKFPIRIDNYDRVNGNADFVFGIETLMEWVENLPTVDAVPVVRCKDCVKRETVLCPLETYDDFPWRASREDDFCSYGEKA